MKTNKGKTYISQQIKELKEQEYLQTILLRAQASEMLHSLSPASLLKNTFTEIASSKNTKQNFIDASLGVGAGLLAKRLFVGGSANIFRKLTGFLLQNITTAIVSKKMPGIREKIADFHTS